MKTIRRYINTSFVVTFVLALVVITFIMSLGAIFRMSDLLARGAAWRPILLVFTSLVPFMMTFAIPVSALMSSLLAFGRLSADGEIMAMRACGISSWQIVFSPVLFSILLVCLCLYINDELAPESHYRQRIAPQLLGTQTPVDLLEEGQNILDFEGLTLRVGRKHGDMLYNVRIWDFRNPSVKRELRATTARVVPSTNRTEMALNLIDVRIDPFYDDAPGAGYCNQWLLKIDTRTRFKAVKKKEPDMTFQELFSRREDLLASAPAAGDGGRERRMAVAVELNKRLSVSLSCMAFVLVGIPLGIKSHRRESSVGIAISFLLAFAFYIFVIIGESLIKRPELRPDLIILLPVAVSLILGPWLLKRMN